MTPVEGAILALLVLVLIAILFTRRIDPQRLESAIGRAWREAGIDEQLGRLAACAEQIQKDYRSLEQMLRVPQERGSFGEIALEQLLKDHLPPEMFGIRERVLDGKVPDAHIRSTAGIICIDAKFPLENYRRMRDAGDGPEHERFKKGFLRDLEGHLAKIAADYVRPERGSAPFAFAYIPSEAVYYFLVSDPAGYDLLRRYTAQGVQVASPLTLGHKLELIKAGVHAQRLNEQAERVHGALLRLRRRVQDVGEKWRVLYRTHLENARRKAEELDGAYRRLQEEFDALAESPDGPPDLPSP